MRIQARNSFNIPFRSPSYSPFPYTFINVNHFGIHDKMLRVYSGEVRGGAKRKLDISNALTPPSINQNGLFGQTLCRPKKSHFDWRLQSKQFLCGKLLYPSLDWSNPSPFTSSIMYYWITKTRGYHHERGYSASYRCGIIKFWWCMGPLFSRYT